MPFSNFPQGFAYGLSVRGMPLLQMQPGQVLFVNNSTVLNPSQKAGSDSNRGSFLDPYATLNFALTQCVSGRGDIVFIGSGHVETITTATALGFATGAAAVIGLGAGSLRPTFIFGAATSTVAVSAANMSIQNCLFQANFADVASIFTAAGSSTLTSTITGTTLTLGGAVTGTVVVGSGVMGTGVTAGTTILRLLTGTASTTGATYEVSVSQTVTSTTITTGPHNFAIDNCEFRDKSSVLNFMTGYTGTTTANASDGFSLTNSRISSLGTTAATTFVKMQAATDRMNISNNFGCWAVLNDTAAMLAAGANNMTNFSFQNNILERPNTSSTGGSFVSTSGTAWTGHAANNLMYQLDASAGIWIATGTGGAFGFSQNFSPVTGAVDKSALINPVAV